jgi:hypothetical protein
LRTDADGLLAARFAATRDGYDDSDWADVLQRVNPRSLAVHRWRPAPVAAAVLAAIALPTLALSASVRELVGLGNRPIPDFRRARLAVAAPISERRVARVWVAPSTDGGECEFVTIDPAGSKPHPVQMTGGGSCTLGHERFHGPLSWSFSHGPRDTPVIHGRVSSTRDAARVELVWRGGAQQLAYHDGYFVAQASAIKDPAFRKLPFDVVAFNRNGHIAAQSPIPTSFLYLDWKRVQPRLHRYRVAHGCDTRVVWRCRSR